MVSAVYGGDLGLVVPWVATKQASRRDEQDFDLQRTATACSKPTK